MLDEPDAANRLLVVEALGAIAPCGDFETINRLRALEAKNVRLLKIGLLNVYQSRGRCPGIM